MLTKTPATAAQTFRSKMRKMVVRGAALEASALSEWGVQKGGGLAVRRGDRTGAYRGA